MKGWLFTRLESGSVYFTPDVRQRLERHRQLGARSKESGGVLLGRHLLDGSDVIVDEITEPAGSDRRSLTSFFRSIIHHHRAFARWRASGGTCAYLGSWHTHPEPTPHPSSVDLQDWQHALARDRYDGNTLFFAIVGTLETRVWQGAREGAVAPLSMTREV